MRTTERTATCAIPEVARLVALASLLALGACEGDRGPAGPEGPKGGGGGGGTDPDEPTPTEYEAGDEVPELRLALVSLGGASGPGGEFLIGDTPVVEFTLAKADGEPWPLDELGEGAALVSGPSFNYQRVLPLEDVLADAVEIAEGHYRYTFASPIPATYPAPYNDTTTFGANGGELQGRNLLDGTYSLGLSFTWEYEYAGHPYRRVAELTQDFLLGTGAGALLARQVTTEAHCNRCHGELEAHDGRFQKLELCLMCHTSGAEDLNDAAIAGGTPGVTIDSRVLFHKLHAGRFLPSVNGVTTRDNGSRNYDAPPVPLEYVRADGTVRDFSHVGFPAFPNRATPMPRDTGYASLSETNQRKEDLMRSMPSDCASCHGDPDGAGGIEPPAQARQIDVPSRRACGSCHDDVVWTSSYRSNGQSMPAQNNDNGCTQCHDSRFDGELAPAYTHRHPLVRADFNAGVNVGLLAVREAVSASNNDGTLDPGEAVELEFTLKNDAGANVQPSTLDELHFVLAGPNTNFQVLYDAALPLPLVTGAQPFVLRLPQRFFESAGRSTAALDVFETERFPHRVSAQSPTQVFARTGLLGARGTLVSAVERFGVELVVSDPRGWTRGDVLVIDDGTANEEYQRVALVDGNRLVLADPNPPSPGRGLVFAHAAGAAVNKVRAVEKTAGVDYTLDAANGRVTELVEFGDGATVILCYAADFRLPDVYPNPPNASDARHDAQGKWTGKELVSGTYVATLAAARELEYEQGTTLTPYRATSPESQLEVLVGDALAAEPYTRIPDATACLDCHQRIRYHDLYEGFTTCLTCHGSGGTEDLARATVPEAPETAGISVEFRDLLHRIHRGNELAGNDHSVVATAPLGSDASFVERRYDGFTPLPSFPDRALDCARCHGDDEAAGLLPSDRSHPEQTHPTQFWSAACLGCHDTQAARAHLASNTAPDGAEACAICHEPGEFLDARQAHFERQAPR
jgi:hypothetical protein